MSDDELERVLGDALIGQPIDLTMLTIEEDLPDRVSLEELCARRAIVVSRDTYRRLAAKSGQVSDDVSSDTAGQDRTP